MKYLLRPLLLILITFTASGQTFNVTGKLHSEGEPVGFANISVVGSTQGVAADSSGRFTLTLPEGSYKLKITAIGYDTHIEKINVIRDISLSISLKVNDFQMNEIVVTGTLKEVNRLETPVPVEVYNAGFFKMNPTPSVFEAMQNVNGVRPQMNCNVCNTGDIHINGLEGPYTMVLIDGMPIVSGLSSVYGLFGIPNSMLERVEVVKGPASSLYGSEAVGGLINVLTKSPKDAPSFTAEITASSWQEINTDLGIKSTFGKNTDVLTGINYFNYSNPIDNNNDGFTDLTLQDRISIFQKWNFNRSKDRIFSLAARYMYEDRWGGEMNWSSSERGGDNVYGESIYTERIELLGDYQLPLDEIMHFKFSINTHDQNSYYGDMPYFADQNIAFTQLTWEKSWGKQDILIGGTYRYTYYDDNTTATAKDGNNDINNPDRSHLPGIFLQDNITINDKQTLLLGMRLDYHSNHGGIYTPRLAYKYKLNDNNILRLNAGTGFRVVNLFTEEHAALTGARNVEIREDLNPEQSYNLNLNYIKKIYIKSGIYVGIDASAWYTFFNNQIIPDYTSDPNKIIYDNLDGHAVTQGIALNIDAEFQNGLTLIAGSTLMDVYSQEGTNRVRPILSEQFTGTWGVSYSLPLYNIGIDYTGNFYSPMKLPVLGENDPRPDMSPWFSIQNIKISWDSPKSGLSIYGGVKNFLDFTPNKNSIARAHDPFDRNVTFDQNGNALVTNQNPYGLTFDPSYVYTSNQGIRGFLGIKYIIE